MVQRLIPAVLVVCLAASGIGACSTDGGEALTVYSGRNEELIGPILERFAEDSGIDVDVRYGDSADLALLIDQEGDRTPADVFISQSPGAAGFLAADGRLAVLGDDVVDAVPAEYRGPDGEWVGLTGRARVLVYNTDAISESELPDSVLDVTAEEYRGRIGVAPANGSFQDFVSVLRDEVGDDGALEWLEGLVAIDAQTYANNTAIVEAVGRGEIDIGLVNHYYNERVLDEDPDASSANHFFVEGDIGSTVLVTTGAIVEGTDVRDQADELLEFLVSPTAQEYFAEETLEYPLAFDVEPVTALPPLETITAPPVDLAALGRDLEATKLLIEQSGLEQQ